MSPSVSRHDQRRRQPCRRPSRLRQRLASVHLELIQSTARRATPSKLRPLQRSLPSPTRIRGDSSWLPLPPDLRLISTLLLQSNFLQLIAQTQAGLAAPREIPPAQRNRADRP